MTSELVLKEDMTAHQVIDYSIFSKLDLNQNTRLEQVKILGHPWKYCAEGNKNIVISLRDERRVIRLPKHIIGEPIEDWNCERKRIFREVNFTNHVFGPLIGSELVGTADVIYISREQISHLNNSMRSIRPKYRLDKELGIPYATSRPDFTRIHTGPSKYTDYCVEIKPKQGCWNHTILDEKSTLCTFCLHQFLKLKQNKISTRSNYCPLDLFSGNVSRMIGALKSLILNPQNNLRLFKDGELVYGENMSQESLMSVLDDWILRSDSSKVSTASSATLHPSWKFSSLHNFLYLICLALLRPQKSIDGREDSSESETHFETLKTQLAEFLNNPGQSSESRKESCDGSSDILPEESLLSRILSVQKLSTCGCEAIYSLYGKICPVHSSSFPDNSCPSPKCLGDEKWLDELPLSQLQVTAFESLCIENYLLATTVKDCSFMITFSPILSSTADNLEADNVLEDLRGGIHEVRVGVADLDPKPVTCIPKHYIRDFEMFQAYKQFTLGG